MGTDLLAVLAFALLAGAWVAVQRWIARHDPDQPGVEGSCHGCRGGCQRDGVWDGLCARDPEGVGGPARRRP